MGRFIAQQWPHVSWIPWFNAGTPIESAYLPLVPAATAALSALTPYDPARAFHIIAAFAYALGPALLFLFARETSGLTGPSVAAALAWSLTSPTLLLNAYRLDDGAWLGLHRLRTIVFYGETPHNVALSLLPLAWLLLARWWRKPDHPLRFALLVVVVAAILLSNAFGVAVVTLSVLLLWLAVGPRNWAGFASTLAMLLISYLLTCAVLRPSLVLQMVASSRTLGGDYRATWRLLVLPVVLSVLWLFLRRVACPVLRFAGLLAACFGVIAIPDAVSGFAIAPLAQRYALEAELGFCLLAAFAFRRMWEHLPRRVLVPALAALGVLLTAADYRFARRIIREADITNSAVYKESAWIKEHFPGRRVFASGDTGFWLDVFTDNPQIAGGHEATANWVERVATYTIYSGQNAGMQDGPISVLWLKAFGCAAITVPGPASRDYFHPVAHPEKFSRLLPLAWQDGEDYIYAVPLRSDSLAHVIPAAAIVSVQPKNGLDVTQVRRYVDALDALEPACPRSAVGQPGARNTEGSDASWRSGVHPNQL